MWVVCVQYVVYVCMVYGVYMYGVCMYALCVCVRVCIMGRENN